MTRRRRNPHRRRHHQRAVGIVLLAVLMLAGACSSGHQTTPTGTAATTAEPTGLITPTEPSAATARSVPAPVTTSVLAGPSFPPVVAFAWLDGPSADPAVRYDLDGVQRWQGSSPGMQAEMLPDGAYRWAAVGGSMVGCAPPPSSGPERARLRCVGVDGAGNTAVTSAAHGVRVVYGPSGAWLGDYSQDGTRKSTTKPAATLAQALADSGVDMASLVDFATAKFAFSGGITGDPHLITAGGVRVTTQKAGDFNARTGDAGHQVQVRLEPMPYQADVSYVDAAAIGVDGHRIVFQRTGILTIDDEPLVSPNGLFRQVLVSQGGPEVGLWPSDADGAVDAVVLWPDGSTVVMSADSSLGLTVTTALPASQVGGLFGAVNLSTDPALTVSTTTSTPNIPDAAVGQRGDFIGRSGSTPSGSSSGSVSLTDQVVESWRVRAGESLFPDTPASVSSAPATPINASAALAAEKVCAAGNIADVEDLAACVFDVARTGDEGYVIHHVELDDAAGPTEVARSVAADWPALTLGSVISPTTALLVEALEGSVPSGDRRTYQLTLNAAAKLQIKAPVACSASAEAGRGAAAVRLFDRTGRPVSSRRPDCGQFTTDTLQPGTYYLVLAAATSGTPTTAAPTTMRATVRSAG